MDWKEVAKLPEREQMRAWVENWKRVGPEMERMKREELRSLTEEDAFEQATILARSAAEEPCLEPARHHSEGLIEQQRLFAKLCQPR